MVRTEEVAVKIADAIFQERLGPDYLHDLPLHIYDDKTNGTWVVCNSPNAQMVVISKSDCRILMARGLQPVYNYIDDEMKIQEKNIAKHDIQYVSMGNINYMTDIKSNQQVEENDVDHLGIRQRTGVIIANAILTEKFGKKYHEDYQVGVVNDVTNEGWIIQTTGVKTRIAMMKKNTCEMIVLMGEK